ncbi:hypothetical protein LUZ60_013652 [Juncus effusus]|nr:hypothetical protein LUZ60_013652 [Juncus effusus]
MGLAMDFSLPQNRWPVRSACLLPGRIRPGSAAVPDRRRRLALVVRCIEGGQVMRTCKNCKSQFDPAQNHPRACQFHTAHFGGETRRKFESVYTGGTMSTPESGKVYQYWHCCGSDDPFHPGCTSSPHCSYDD